MICIGRHFCLGIIGNPLCLSLLFILCIPRVCCVWMRCSGGCAFRFCRSISIVCFWGSAELCLLIRSQAAASGSFLDFYRCNSVFLNKICLEVVDSFRITQLILFGSVEP